MASSNLERLLGVSVSPEQRDFVAWKGGDVFDMSSKAVAVFSRIRGMYLL